VSKNKGSTGDRQYWREFTSSAEPHIRFRLLLPTRTKPGTLVVINASTGVSHIQRLNWEASQISRRLARCPCYERQLVVYGFNDGGVRLRSLALDHHLMPPDRSDPQNPEEEREERAELGAEATW
jgi:hypothetical protein